LILAFADVELDLDLYELRRTGNRVAIEPQVFDVLVQLVSNAPRVVTKEELLDAVWGDRFVSESALTSRIKAARRAVGDDGTRQEIIATVHGRGYRVVVDVRERDAYVPDVAPAPATSARGQPRLLERDDHLAELDRAFEAARAGSGRLVCVVGEAGIGKSSLLQAFVDRLGPEQLVLFVGCDDLLAPRPLGPVRDLVAQLPGDVQAGLADDLTGTGLARALHGVGAGRGGVIVIEDVHWADDATVDVIRQLTSRVRQLPFVIVISYRDEDIGLGHPLRKLLGTLRGPHVAHVRLGPLSAEAVAVLAVDSARDAAEVHAASGGNPLFATELIATPPGNLPGSIKDAVVSRLGELSPQDVDVVRALSVVPVRVERQLVEVLCSECDASLVAAEQRGILSGDASHVWFRHELVRHAVEDTLASSEAVRLHRRLASHLHDRGEDPARVVHHAVRCNDIDLLIEAGPVAARQAVSAGAHRQAVQHLDAVLAHAQRLSAADRAELLTLRTHSLYLLNRFDASLASGTEAVEAAAGLPDAQVRARALMGHGRTALWAVGPDASCRAIEQALDALGDEGDAELRATAHADMARALGELVTIGSVAQGNPSAAAHAERALALADQLGQHALRGYALMYRGSERLASGDSAGSRELDEAIAILTSSPRTDLAVRACVNAAGAAFRSGRFDAAERYVEQGLQLAKGTEFFSGEYRLSLTRASVRVSRGRWREAEAELRALLTAGGEPGIMEPLARCLLARVLARQGQHDEAGRLVAAASSVAGRTDEARLLGPIAIADVETRWLAGDVAGLAEAAQRALTLAAATGNHTIAAELSRYLRWAGVDTGQVADAPEPWASGLRGDWQTAASLWQRRGEPYEEALELVSGAEAAATRGIELLRSLGAEATIAALRARATTR
jgi:DNA-binding winged helix-turn-helix (wHTH) protein/tetratricopeptide (TPR) repeat protein